MQYFGAGDAMSFVNKVRHITLITVDSLRYDALTFMPFVKWLTYRGALFLRYYTNGVPTHAFFPSLHTSTYPFWRQKPDNLNGVSVRNRPTLAEVLNHNGFINVTIIDAKENIMLVENMFNEIVTRNRLKTLYLFKTCHL